MLIFMSIVWEVHYKPYVVSPSVNALLDDALLDDALLTPLLR